MESLNNRFLNFLLTSNLSSHQVYSLPAHPHQDLASSISAKGPSIESLSHWKQLCSKLLLPWAPIPLIGIYICLCFHFWVHPKYNLTLRPQPFWVLAGQLPRWLSGKEYTCQVGDARDTGSIPGSGRSPGEGNDNTLRSSYLENPMDRGTWRATVHGVIKESDVTERLNNNSRHLLGAS